MSTQDSGISLCSVDGPRWIISHPYDIVYEDKIKTIKPDDSRHSAKATWLLCSDCASKDEEGPCRREHLTRICYDNPAGDSKIFVTFTSITDILAKARQRFGCFGRSSLRAKVLSPEMHRLKIDVLRKPTRSSLWTA